MAGSRPYIGSARGHGAPNVDRLVGARQALCSLLRERRHLSELCLRRRESGLGG